MKLGRPKKYDGSLTNISLAIPPAVNSLLIDESNELNISRNEYVINLIINSDKELAKNTVLKFQELQKVVEHLTTESKNLNDKLLSLTKNFVNVFENLEVADAETEAIINSYKEGYLKVLQEGILTFEKKQNWIKLIYSKIEEEKLLKNQRVKRKEILMDYIRKKLVEFEKEQKGEFK